jgi:mRNA interferase RelE/StbE
LDREARDFIASMQPKHARQVLLRILDLCATPQPHDAKALKGTVGEYTRVDSGEYRIVYRVQGEDLEIRLIGKRNDDEVYKEMRRKGL